MHADHEAAAAPTAKPCPSPKLSRPHVDEGYNIERYDKPQPSEPVFTSPKFEKDTFEKHPILYHGPPNSPEQTKPTDHSPIKESGPCLQLSLTKSLERYLDSKSLAIKDGNAVELSSEQGQLDVDPAMGEEYEGEKRAVTTAATSEKPKPYPNFHNLPPSAMPVPASLQIKNIVYHASLLDAQIVDEHDQRGRRGEIEGKEAARDSLRFERYQEELRQRIVRRKVDEYEYNNYMANEMIYYGTLPEKDYENPVRFLRTEDDWYDKLRRRVGGGIVFRDENGQWGEKVKPWMVEKFDPRDGWWKDEDLFEIVEDDDFRHGHARKSTKIGVRKDLRDFQGRWDELRAWYYGTGSYETTKRYADVQNTNPLHAGCEVQNHDMLLQPEKYDGEAAGLA